MIDCAVDVIGLDCDVTVGAGALFVHHFELGACENRLGADLRLEGEVIFEGFGSICGGVPRGIDTDMLELKSEHNVDGLAHELGNAVEISCCDHFGLDHPRAATASDLGKSEVVVHVSGTDATRGHKGDLAVRRGHSLDHSDTARLLCGEELDRIKSKLESRFDTRGIVESGHDGAVLFLTVLNDLGIKAGADDKLCACLDSVVDLCLGEHCTRTDDNFGELLDHNSDGFLSASGSEGDLSARQTACDERFCKRSRIGGIFDLDYGNDTNFGKLFYNVVHIILHIILVHIYT